MTADIVTYPEMNDKIVELLRWDKENPMALYAATRIEGLEAQVGRLLERAQRAEAALQEAVARGAVLQAVVDDLCKQHTLQEDLEEAGCGCLYLSRFPDWEEAWKQAREIRYETTAATAALLERLAELEAQAEDLRGALRAALTPLEAAAAALVPPGARVEEAAALVDEALTVMHEELE